jgi:hypothetical protein
LSEAHILPLVEPVTRNPFFQIEMDTVQKRPISFAPTAFHFVVLRGDRLQFLSSLNGDLVQEELLKSENGIPISLVRDSSRNVNYLYTNNNIYQVNDVRMLFF